MYIRCHVKNSQSKNLQEVLDSRRNEIYKILMASLTKIEKNYFDHLNGQLYSNIASYLKMSLDNWKKNNDDSERIIDTGVLLLGVNTSDHCNTFSNLNRSMKDSSYCHVIRINSNNCKTIKKMLEIICTKIISDDFVKLNLPNSLKYTVLSLKLWANQNKNMLQRQIVLVLEDVESFNATLLQSIIETVSKLLPLFPIVLLVGITSNTDILNEMLTIRSLSRISIQTFRTLNPVTLLNNFIIKLTESSLPFQLSHQLYSYIINHMFFCLDFSMKNLLNRYKYCVLEHIMHNDEAFQLLSKEYLNKNTLSDTVISQHVSHLKLTCILINWLLDLFNNFQDTKLGKYFYKLFGIQLLCGIGKSDEFKTTLDLFRSLSPEAAAESIRRANSRLSNMKENNYLIDDFLTISEKYANEFINGKSQATAYVAAIKDIKRKPSMRSQYQKDLLKNIELGKLNKESSTFDEFSNWIREWFSKNLPHYSMLEGYNGVYFDDLEHFKENMNPSMKTTIENALINPIRYIKNEKLHLATLSNINKFMPDSCIIFKLINENTRTINLYDLLQSFSVIIDEENPENVPSSKTQCRFMQSIAELQFLGIIKKKNADYISKLTWSGLLI